MKHSRTYARVVDETKDCIFIFFRPMKAGAVALSSSTITPNANAAIAIEFGIRPEMSRCHNFL